MIYQEDNRKKEILDATELLIAEKGLNNVSTTDIAAKVGIARGTLYHYFPNKEMIIDQLVQRTSNNIFAEARSIAEKKEISILDRLALTVKALNVSSDSGKALVAHLNSKDNIILHNKVEKEMMENIPQIFTIIIKDGIREGIFKSDYPYETMELIISYVIGVIDGNLVELDQEEQVKRIIALLSNLELMLNTEKGLLLQYYGFN